VLERVVVVVKAHVQDKTRPPHWIYHPFYAIYVAPRPKCAPSTLAAEQLCPDYARNEQPRASAVPPLRSRRRAT